MKIYSYPDKHIIGVDPTLINYLNQNNNLSLVTSPLEFIKNDYNFSYETKKELNLIDINNDEKDVITRLTTQIQSDNFLLNIENIWGIKGNKLSILKFMNDLDFRDFGSAIEIYDLENLNFIILDDYHRMYTNF